MLAADDEGRLHLLHGPSAVPLLDSAVVSRDDDDALIPDAGILHGLDNLSHIAVYLLQFLVVERRIMPRRMAHMVQRIEHDIHQRRLLLLDILHRETRRSGRIVGHLHDMLVIIQRQRIDQEADAAPFIDRAYLCLRRSCPQLGKDSREYPVLINYPRRQVGNLRTPLAIAVQLRSGAHIHRRPVHGTRRRQHRPLLQRVRPAVHQATDIRDLRLVHAIRAPTVNADKDHMLRFPLALGLFRGLCRTTRQEQSHPYKKK